MALTVAIGGICGLTSWREIVGKYSDCKIVFLGNYFNSCVSEPHLLIDNFLEIIHSVEEKTTSQCCTAAWKSRCALHCDQSKKKPSS